MKNEIVCEGNNFLGYFLAVFLGFHDPHMILVILTVFLASRGAAEEKNCLRSKQSISETSQKGEDGDYFEKELKGTIHF